ncbi:ECF RNA polymerase sigma factor RpoE [compost metagenome]
METPLDIQEEPHRADFSTAESYVAHVDLNERIERLPAIQARLLRMSYFEAKSHLEISTELGMPLGTVKSHIRRAFQRLQAGLQETA